MELNPEFEALLEYLKNCRGFDFTSYKRASLMRRVNRRMQTIKIPSYTDYVDYLEVHPDEFIQLFNTLLINVTSFFRDRPAWDYIIEQVIPNIIQTKSFNDPIRLWSAGCASGEEAYTLAIIIAEAMGSDRVRERVKIYATDIDEEALTQARLASYSEREVEGIPSELLSRYFEPGERGYVFRKDLRRAVIFGHHDLVQDAPISRIDLLVCRNALMYFNAEAQARILARFHFALNDGGYLFLGKAEMLLTHNSIFTAVDVKQRIFHKVPRVNLRERSLNLLQRASHEVQDIQENPAASEAAFDASPVAQIVVDLKGNLSLVNESARMLFGLPPRDIGRPLQDLEISYRPVELRSCIERAYLEQRSVFVRDVEWLNSRKETIYLNIQVLPLISNQGIVLGVSITFTDITRYKRLQDELQISNQELEMAYEELQSTNEELETTNEELQSTVEELETTNEELQSTNEELETMNEELQSTNEELQTINDEFRRRSEELNEVNAFLGSILASLRGGVVVIDRDLQILVWNDKAHDLWGLRSDEVLGRPFLTLDIGLSVDQLLQPIRSCLAGESSDRELTLTAINRRGKEIQCQVTCTPLISTNSIIHGVILVMETVKGD